MTDPFASKASTPSLSFSRRDEFGQLQSKPFGTRLGGKANKSPEIVQSRFYEGTDKGKPMFWDNDGKGKQTANSTSSDGRPNSPINQIVIEVTTPEGDAASLWVPYYPKDMYEAIQGALAGRAIEKGDDIFVTLTGKRPIAGKNPAHTYSAEFNKGQGVFAPAPVEQPVVVPVPPKAPEAEPTLSNGFTASALKAAGWADAQIEALSAPAPAAPPAPPAAPPAAVSDRDKRLAEMSDEDRKLLNL